MDLKAVPGHFVPPAKVLAENLTGIAAVCNFSAVTPACLRTLYDTIDYTPQVPGANRIGLNNFLGETSNRSDTQIFLKMFRPDAVSAAYTFKQVSIAGGTVQQTPNDTVGLEGNLDIETIIGITYPTPATAFSTGGSPPYKSDVGTPTDTNEPYGQYSSLRKSQLHYHSEAGPLLLTKSMQYVRFTLPSPFWTISVFAELYFPEQITEHISFDAWTRAAKAALLGGHLLCFFV